jgi:hypothetical protein
MDEQNLAPDLLAGRRSTIEPVRGTVEARQAPFDR